MQEQTVFAAALAFSAAPVWTFRIIVAAGLVLHIVVVTVAIGILC